MKCPKCGNELEEGKLLCGFCGEEVKIVPLFETEIENQIDETLGNIVKNMISQDSGLEDEPVLEDTDKLPVVALWKTVGVAFLGLLVVAVIMIAAVVNINKKNYENSFEYQYQTAMNYMDEGAYDQAIRYLEHALAIDSENEDARYQLGVLYIKVNQYNAGMKVLYELLQLDTQHKEKVYDTLLSNLLSNMNYPEMAKLLKDCPYENVVSKYYLYSSFAPEFSQMEAVLEKPLSLELSAKNEGIIYYTLDGTNPTTNSSVYDEPLLLESGDYTVKAMFVNMYGCASDIVSKSYYINLALPPEPEISLDTGVYHEPSMIEVYHDKSTKIYYTLDGSNPTKDSMRYTEPIEMPYGTCNISFIAINDKGLCSNIVRRTFQLNVERPISAELAVVSLKNHLFTYGLISDLDGHLADKSGYNTYKVKTIVLIQDEEYYIIEEAYVDDFGVMQATNNLYAVNCAKGDACIARKTGEGKYILQKFR